MENFDFDKIKDMEYDPSRDRYISSDGSELKVSINKDGSGYKYDYYKSTTINNEPHEADHIRADLSGNWTDDHHNEDKTEWTHTSGSGCYLTTACMQHYMEEFDDNCYYLEMLRWFRDKFVSIKDQQKYYEIAPKIVEEINALENANEIYNDIYYNVIQLCVRLIEDENFNDAYNVYKNSVMKLEKQYIKN